jgi:hypothetical protein
MGSVAPAYLAALQKRREITLPGMTVRGPNPELLPTQRNAAQQKAMEQRQYRQGWTSGTPSPEQESSGLLPTELPQKQMAAEIYKTHGVDVPGGYGEPVQQMQDSGVPVKEAYQPAQGFEPYSKEELARLSKMDDWARQQLPSKHQADYYNGVLDPKMADWLLERADKAMSPEDRDLFEDALHENTRVDD